MSEQENKKDLTQEQLEAVLEEQLNTFSAVLNVVTVGFMVFLLLVWPLIGINFLTLPIWFKLVWWVATGMVFLKINRSLRARRIRKTVEALKAL